MAGSLHLEIISGVAVGTASVLASYSGGLGFTSRSEGHVSRLIPFSVFPSLTSNVLEFYLPYAHHISYLIHRFQPFYRPTLRNLFS